MNQLFGLQHRSGGVVAFGYPTATQKHKKSLQIGICRVLFVAGGGPEPSTSGL